MKNQGANTTSSGFYTRMSADRSFSASNNWSSALSEGGTTILRWTYTAPSVTDNTNITLSATADHTGIITKSNESNNGRSLTVTVKSQAKPDLVVSSLTTDKSSYTSGDTIKVTANVKNQGDGSTNISSYTRLSTTNSGMAASNKSTTTLAAGASTSLTWTYTAPEVSKTNIITLTGAADYTNVVTESNENNNTKTAQITVNPKPKYADLVISSLTTDKSSYISGDTVTATAVVKNQGEVSTRVNSVTQLTSNNAAITTNNSSTSILDPGDSTTLKWTYTVPVVSNDTNVTLTATADYTKVVIESNEDNNTKTHSFMIAPKIAISVGGDN